MALTYINCHKKANSTLGFLRRNICHCPINSKRTAYIALVHSVLEYGAIVRDPYHQGDIDRLERIQHRANHFIYINYRSRPEGCVSTMLINIESHNPQNRQRDQRLSCSEWLRVLCRPYLLINFFIPKDQTKDEYSRNISQIV